MFDSVLKYASAVDKALGQFRGNRKGFMLIKSRNYFLKRNSGKFLSVFSKYWKIIGRSLSLQKFPQFLLRESFCCEIFIAVFCCEIILHSDPVFSINPFSTNVSLL